MTPFPDESRAAPNLRTARRGKRRERYVRRDPRFPALNIRMERPFCRWQQWNTSWYCRYHNLERAQESRYFPEQPRIGFNTYCAFLSSPIPETNVTRGFVHTETFLHGVALTPRFRRHRRHFCRCDATGTAVLPSPSHPDGFPNDCPVILDLQSEKIKE